MRWMTAVIQPVFVRISGSARGDLLELRARQLRVHRERAEAAAAARREIVGDEVDERRVRRVPDAPEQHAAALRIDRPADELLAAFVGDLREIRADAGGILQLPDAGERAVGEAARAGRGDLGDLGLVPVRDAEPIAQIVGCGRGARVVVAAESVEQLAHAQAVAVRRSGRGARATPRGSRRRRRARPRAARAARGSSRAPRCPGAAARAPRRGPPTAPTPPGSRAPSRPSLSCITPRMLRPVLVLALLAGMSALGRSPTMPSPRSRRSRRRSRRRKQRASARRASRRRCR